MSEENDLIAQRYGVKAKRTAMSKKQRALAISGLLVAIGLTAGFTVITYNPISFREISFRVESAQSVTVDFEVNSPVGSEVTCFIEALNNQFGVVGFKRISLPAAQEAVNRYSIRLNTTELAVTGLVDRCELD